MKKDVFRTPVIKESEIKKAESGGCFVMEKKERENYEKGIASSNKETSNPPNYDFAIMNIEPHVELK